MAFRQFDRDRLSIRPLGERRNRIDIERTQVRPTDTPKDLSARTAETVGETVERIVTARRGGRSVMLTFGAHTIKNGLGPVLIRLAEEGWVTHLATNGAGIIHDWEFAFQGESGEDVKAYVAQGQFGIWHETGFYLNLALNVGAYEGLGYGESVGAMVHNEGVRIPDEAELRAGVGEGGDAGLDRSAAALDLLGVARKFHLAPGWMSVPHPFKAHSAQAAAYRLKVPFTGHPMIGQDIIYTHPMNQGAAVGRTGLRDFLVFADSVGRIDGGVYLSVGSAVMSPMIFEKAFSMCQNVGIQEGRRIETHFMAIVDLAPLSEVWGSNTEPPPSDPAYYQRYNKTFARMGGTMRYIRADNRDFLLALYQGLRKRA